MKRILLPVFLLCTICIQASDTDNPATIQLKKGMTGYTLSCFQGTEPSRLNVEIIGILHNNLPDTDRIIGRITGDPVDRAGVMSGMSGSPVYIDNQLIGAIGYSFPYSEDSLCGITPIKAMRNVLKYLPEHPVKKRNPLFRTAGLLKNPIKSSETVMERLKTPVMIAGMSRQAFDALSDSPHYTTALPYGIPVLGGASHSFGSTGNGDIVPGGTVGAAFITGDISVAGVGTVTEVSGKNVLAFAHGMFNTGLCTYPMCAGEVVTFVPSMMNSFKMTNIGHVAGAFLFDHESCLAGETDQDPGMIPIKIHFQRETADRHYEISVLNDPEFTSTYMAMGIGGILASNGTGSGDFAYEMNIKITLDQYESVELRQISGLSDNPYSEMFNAMSIVEDIIQNPIQPVSIHTVDVTITFSESVNVGILESVRLAGSRFDASQSIPVHLSFRKYRGTTERMTTMIPVPRNTVPGTYQLKIMDASAYDEFLSQSRKPAILFETLEDYLKDLLTTSSENQLHLILVKKTVLGRMGGDILPNIPPSLQSIIRSSASDSAIRPGFDIVSEKSLVFPFHTVGREDIDVTITTGS